VSRQEATTCFTSAYVANRLPARFFLKGPKRWSHWAVDGAVDSGSLPLMCSTVTSQKQHGALQPLQHYVFTASEGLSTCLYRYD
jgi:hypothetical protein